MKVGRILPRATLALALGGAHSARAQEAVSTPPEASAPGADQGVTADTEQGPEDSKASAKPEKLAWRGTSLAWGHEVSAQTLGIGDDYQSADPLYDWTFSFSPRYYLIDGERYKMSVRAQLGLFYELTNSDSTTRQGEIDTAPDYSLSLGHDFVLRDDEGYETTLGVTLPDLAFPTSAASRNNGTILRLGTGVSPRQNFEILGSDSEVLPSASIGARARYRYLFTSTTEPTNEDIAQLRSDLHGSTLLSDQLGGANFAPHQLRLGFDLGLQLLENVSLSSAFDWSLSWKYPVSHTAQVCNLLTGCATPDGAEDPRTLAVGTSFSVGGDVQVSDEVGLSVSYAVSGSQIGPDGQRRSMFYNQDAAFAAEISVSLDALYLSTKSKPSGSGSAASSAQTRVSPIRISNLPPRVAPGVNGFEL